MDLSTLESTCVLARAASQREEWKDLPGPWGVVFTRGGSFYPAAKGCLRGETLFESRVLHRPTIVGQTGRRSPVDLAEWEADRRPG